MRRKKYLDLEQALHFIFENVDRDGIWLGDAASLGADFDVSEDDAYSVLSELCDRRIIQRVYKQTYVIVNWRDRDDSDGPSETF
jgi:hypothetical protein